MYVPTYVHTHAHTHARRTYVRMYVCIRTYAPTITEAVVVPSATSQRIPDVYVFTKTFTTLIHRLIRYTI